jgi:uncharacterized YccA/Bax inhibitor family protein
MHFLYYQDILKVNNKFRIAIGASSMVVLFFLITNFIISSFGGGDYLSGKFSQLIISGILLMLGSAFLAIDFDNAEQIIKFNISKKYEWSLAFAFLTTLMFIFWQIAKILIINILEKE